MFSEVIRQYGFWFVDALGGGYVGQYVADLEKKLQGDFDTSSDDLRKLLDHAVNSTDFYGKYRGYSGIKDFPIIKKNLVKEKYNQFISSDYKNRRLYKVQTSGSTGERFTMLQDKQKRKRVVAELIYFLNQCGFRLGYRHIYARVWHSDNDKTKLTFMMHNTIKFDCSCLSDKSLDKFYQLLSKDTSIKCITGYATALAAIVLYFDRKGYTPDMFNIKVIVSGAERLEPKVKDMLKKVFGCTVVSRYANNENGFLAQQTNDGDNFILNTSHYFFEKLKLDSDEPASYGEPARLVLTDLYNYAMPLIRYDTEDIVIMENVDVQGHKKNIIKEISGRKADIIYDTRGNKISPHYVAIIFRKYDKLPEFQLIQESLEKFTLKLEGARSFYEDEDFQATVRQLVGPDAIVKIEHVDKIPHLSSGKMRKIICNLNADARVD
ncbi:coenzyme f390 synthetase [hydrocarbon metagenome]|uniref:Coenzyme f390 synthetase n=1 Tax=hydrocarbon metagenome TaxID=938273 RepID=A0A0W8FSV9_9ZZZZ